MDIYRLSCLTAPSIVVLPANGLWVADSESDNERLWAVKVIGHEGEEHIITASVSDKGEYAIVPIYHLTLSRFNHQGTLDTSFGDNGQTTIAVTAPEDQPITLYPLQQQESAPLILVGKYASPSCECDNNVLTAFLFNGTQDERFDTPFNQFGGGNAAVRAIGSLSFENGEKRIIVAGYGFDLEGGSQQSDIAGRDFMVATYHLSGQPDACFGMTTEQLRDTVDCQLYFSEREDSTVSPSTSTAVLASTSIPSKPTSVYTVPVETPATCSCPACPGSDSSSSAHQGSIAGISTVAALAIAGILHWEPALW